MVAVLRILAWLVLAALLVATLGPIGLRPHTPWSPNLERFAAFIVVGGLFALAYPRRWLTVSLLVLGAATVLELGQACVPGRHPALRDFVIKAAGGGVGIAAGLVADRLRRRFCPR